MSRRRGPARAAKAVPPSAFSGRGGGGVTYSAEQVAAMMSAQAKLSSGNTRAEPLPSSPFWETAPFGPGRRLVPAPINVPRADTGRAEPRLWQFPVSWNLQVDDRAHVPWQTLRRAADMPLFRKCIESRKGICQNDFTVTVDPAAVAREAHATGSSKTDVEAGLRDKYLADISRVTDWLQVPDRKNDLAWNDWCSLLMENRLKYDAAVVYPRKTYGGDIYSFEIVDGSTIKPLLDESGGRPLPPYPAFQQMLYGFPRGEFTADCDPDQPDPLTGKARIPGGYPADVLYYQKSVYRSESPYGMSPTEIALFDGLLWMRRMGWVLAEYTEGVMPTGLLETSEETSWTPQQWEDWARALNDHLAGNTAERHRWPLMPPGVKFVQGEEIAEKYQPDYDMFLITLVAGDFGLPPSEIGFTQTGALGASFHEGEEDILYRKTRLPDANWLAAYATKLAIRELGMPPALKVQILGLEWEDEAAADATAQSRVSSARMTLNEDRARQGLPPYDFEEADKPMLITGRGVVFLEGASKQAPPGTLVGPAVAPPAGMAGAAQDGQDGQGPQDSGEDQGDEDGEQDASPAAKTAELSALRKWLSKHPNPARPFTCKALTASDIPGMEYATDPRVVLKAGDDAPKALSGTGPAGSGTSSW